MTFFEIPVSNQFPWHQYKINLSGVIYTLRFRYNNRSSRWEMDIADAANNNIVEGLTMLIASDLSYQYKTGIPTIPVGSFFVIDKTGANLQPTLYSFGVTHALLYGDPTQ